MLKGKNLARARHACCHFISNEQYLFFITYQSYGLHIFFGRDIDTALTLNEFGGWGAFNGDPSNTNGIGNYFLSARPSCSGPLRTVDKFVPADPATNRPAFIEWFDTSVVSHPLNAFGSCPVGNGRGPGVAQVDMSLHKDFTITEHKRLQFRAEFINLFNRPIWTFSGGPAGGSFDPGTPVVGSGSLPSFLTTNPNFGNVTGSQGARNIQFALKFYY